MPDRIDTLQALKTLEVALRQEMAARACHAPLMVGIHRGGVWVAEYLHQALGFDAPLGRLDINFYRDDFSSVGLHPKVQASSLPVPIEGRDVLLIDDVFYTGRTSRAALNVLFDYGRPRKVILGVLIERDGREIPLRPDCRGGQMQLPRGERLKLFGPDPLELRMTQTSP